MSELTYPFNDAIPDFGCVQPVAEGVYWIRMPLPLTLDHINLYLLADDDGWWIVDTGLKHEPIREYWNTLFDTVFEGKPLKGVIVTHNHPDHIGMAGWLCDKFRAPLYITFGEYYMGKAFTSFSGDELSWPAQEFYTLTGFDADYFTRMKTTMKGYTNLSEPLPTAFRRIEDGYEFIIAGRSWKVVVGSGHSPEHACLYCEELAVLCSGDQVIPRISSNISVMPAEPEGNPLARWLDSLEYFKQLPADLLVLPAHNTPFYGLHQRLDTLIEHHEDHLLALEEACVVEKTTFELLPVLFKRELNEEQTAMAVSECVAHLNYLVYANKLQRTVNAEGKYAYLSIAPDLSARARPGTHLQDEEPFNV